MNNEKLLQLLWKEFISKIREDWDLKYQDFGSLKKINQQTKFCKVLRADMIKSLPENHKRGNNVITWQTLNNYFKQGKLGKHPKPQTLDIVSKYLGYKNYEDFKINVEEDILDIGLENPESLKFSKKSVSLKTILFGLFLIGILSALILNIYQTIEEKENSEIQVRNLITKANNLQYALYARVPDVKDTVLLEMYFQKSGEAISTVKEIIRRRNQLNTTLDIKESSYKVTVDRVEFPFLHTNKARVHTIEYWKLIWISTESGNVEVDYETSNAQTYDLIRDDDSWLIKRNDYNTEVKYH